MGKSDLVQAIVEQSANEISKKNVELVLDALPGAIKSMLKDNNDVVLVGFGSFKVGVRSARTGRNPSSGETIQIAEKRTVKFKASPVFSKGI